LLFSTPDTLTQELALQFTAVHRSTSDQEDGAAAAQMVAPRIEALYYLDGNPRRPYRSTLFPDTQQESHDHEI
jgi:hypothetical protein